jgi:cellulose synthase/poly-beta-1,6-N-acetylglucosamine synthase-like glycosyltransferase
MADKVVLNTNRMIAIQRNTGAKVAQGEILVFVDADARLEPDFLIHCDRAMRDPATVAATGLATGYDGNRFHRWVYQATYWLVKACLLVGVPLFPGICVAYRREQFNKIGGFREDVGMVDDLDMSNRIARMGRCCIAADARATVSTRRLHKHPFSAISFHIYNDLRYLLTGKAASVYPKSEHLNSWLDLWRPNRSTKAKADPD